MSTRQTHEEDLDDHLLEGALLPGLGGVAHHDNHSIVELVVLLVQEHKLAPHLGLLGSAEDLHTDTQSNA